jgi:hypothetical protein
VLTLALILAGVLGQEPAHQVPAHQVPAHQVPAHQVPAHQVQQQPRPNLVVIVADDLGYHDLSLAGNT